MPSKPASSGARATGGTTKTTQAAASRIQSTQAKAGNDTGKDSFPSRVQSSAAKNANANVGAGTKTGKGGKTV